MFVWEKEEINKDQEDAINAHGSVLLIACPGSGVSSTGRCNAILNQGGCCHETKNSD